jgi:hypothetical protein
VQVALGGALQVTDAQGSVVQAALAHVHATVCDV